MPRLRPHTYNPMRDEIEEEIKKQYGNYLNQSQVGKYLGYGKTKTAEIIKDIPFYRDSQSGKKRYRAVELAEYIANQRIGV